MIEAIIRELEVRKHYLRNESIQSIYFGGGTPSLLNERELNNILGAIFQTYDVIPGAEITLEANPDDLSKATLDNLKKSGINRLSIGVQTFDDPRLKFINRAHTSEEAIKSLDLAQQAGFENVSADLIYAIPPDDLEYWENDLSKMLSFGLPHLSIYGLTIEEKTAFGNWVRKGKLKEVPEDLAASQFRKAHQVLTAHGYEHYEVSNYAKEGKYSRHNSAYWDNQKYLGVGPGAHSYDGTHRGFNINNNAKYLSSMKLGAPPLTIEALSSADLANEFILTRLRTKWGIDAAEFKAIHHKDLLNDHEEIIMGLCSEGMMSVAGDRICLTLEGFMLADEITWRLLYDQE